MESTSRLPRTRRAWPLALLLATCCFAALVSSATQPSAADSKNRTAKTVAPSSSQGARQTTQGVNQKGNPTYPSEPPDVAAFRRSVGGAITPVIVELKGAPAVLHKVAAEREGRSMPVKDVVAYSLRLLTRQDEFLATLRARGVRALPRETDVPQIDGSVRHIEYRFTYLLNGFVAYVATEDLARLRTLPEVEHVSEEQPMRLLLDRAVDYSLGTQPGIAERRAAVYGPNQEFRPAGEPGHPEAPRTTKIDGFEGQNINVAIIDTGVDYRHPMFGGTGNTTPLPRIAGRPESPSDNKKVIYYYALFVNPDPTDDFGHGTLVASNAAGYLVDGNTPPNPGFGLGVNPPQGIGPTPGGVELFGVAPQARIMAYKVCDATSKCVGDTSLAIEDAASPVTILGRSEGRVPTTVPKPVADVINLSLGDEAGDPAGPTSRAANNAALAGTIVVASAGNSGPGAGTIGAPSAATLAISVAASLDPGSVPAADVLAPNQIPGETRVPATPGPPPETDVQPGDPSSANSPQTGERQGMKIFPVAGGGAIPGGSLSAHYVFVDRRGTAPVPASVTNRIALVKGTGAFASIANPVAALNPAAILIITTVESATAVVVVNGVPTYTISPANGDYLIDKLLSNDAGDGDNNVDVPNGSISELPLRLGESATLAAFEPGMASFSSRGPNDHPNARFRTIKPDVTAPGVGILGAATAEGVPEETIGLASLTGYVQANGTSFSGPITAGAMALVRQRVREELNLDSTDLNAANYRARRFDTVTVARALLMNSATNLRSGLGVPQPDGASSNASINDMGAGHINIAGALRASAIMVAPTLLLAPTDEFAGEFTPQAAVGNLTVLIPSASFGIVPVVGLNAVAVRTREVVIRDVTGSGGGTYILDFENNRNVDDPGFRISFTATPDSATPITAVNVPSGGQTSFFVRVAADGSQITADQKEFQWFVTATQTITGQSLRMPFYYRAARVDVPNITSPTQAPPENTEQPAPASSDCAVDANGSYRLRWSYNAPSGGPSPAGFRVQEATRTETRFFDNADETLVAGSNSKWTGSAQWNSQTSPNTGSLAYYIPDAAEQNESLTMTSAVTLPAGGATLSFTTTQDFEDGFDNGFVEVSTDNGTSFTTVLTLANDFVGTRVVDLSPFAGQSVKVRFRMVSDLLNGPPDATPLGWWVEDIRLSSDDFRTIAETGAEATSLDLTRPNGTYFYRIAGLFNTAEGPATGPSSNQRCVTVSGSSNPTPSPTPLPTPVPIPPTPTPTPSATPSPSPSASPTPTPPAVPTVQFSASSYPATEGCTALATITVTRTGAAEGTATVDYVMGDNTARQKSDFTFASGRLAFASGETSKTFTVLINEDGYAEGTETSTITLFNPSRGTDLGNQRTATLDIADNDSSDAATNPIDSARTFACQHYHDFLNRQGDAEGEAFWTDQVAACGNDARCLDERRENVSAAFFLSIEFQNTGYLVYRMHRASFATLPRYELFLRDARRISEGVVVGAPGWPQKLEANKQAFADEWVTRPEFRARYRAELSREQYIDTLFANSEVTPSQAEREAALAAYGNGGNEGRARALRSIAESSSVYNQQYNSGFVLMQYFGYLRRDPDDAPDTDLSGYNFWLKKLNDFTGPGEDARDETVALRRVKRAEMVKAFIRAREYRERFGPP